MGVYRGINWSTSSKMYVISEFVPVIHFKIWSCMNKKVTTSIKMSGLAHLAATIPNYLFRLSYCSLFPIDSCASWFAPPPPPAGRRRGESQTADTTNRGRPPSFTGATNRRHHYELAAWSRAGGRSCGCRRRWPRVVVGRSLPNLGAALGSASATAVGAGGAAAPCRHPGTS
jgi:hypothetical protein